MEVELSNRSLRASKVLLWQSSFGRFLSFWIRGKGELTPETKRGKLSKAYKTDARNPAIAPRLEIEPLGRRVGDPCR